MIRHSDDEYDLDEYEYNQLQLHSCKPSCNTDNRHETTMYTPNTEPFEGCDLSPIQILTPTTLHSTPQQQQNIENDTDYNTGIMETNTESIVF